MLKAIEKLVSTRSLVLYFMLNKCKSDYRVLSLINDYSKAFAKHWIETEQKRISGNIVIFKNAVLI